MTMIINPSRFAVASGGGGTPHRYWRLRLEEAWGNPVALSEIQFRPTPGTNMPYTGVGFGSSLYSSDFSVAKAFDGNNATDWAAASNTAGEYIGYDFGAGNEVAVEEILYRARNDYPTQTMKIASVQWSDNNADWTTDWIAYFSAFSGGQTKLRTRPEAPPVGAHRAWRLKWDASPRGFGSCARLEFRSEVGGADRTQEERGVPISAAEYGGYPASYAFDRDAGSFYSSNGGAPYLGWDFGLGGGILVNELVYYPRPDGADQGDGPRGGGLEWSDDMATWTRDRDIVPPTTYVANNGYSI